MKIIDKVLDEMKDVKMRKCNFIATICYIDELGIPHYFEGKVFGNIGYERIGNNGFGYDPVFCPAEYNYEYSMAALPAGARKSP